MANRYRVKIIKKPDPAYEAELREETRRNLRKERIFDVALLLLLLGALGVLGWAIYHLFQTHWI
jgi:hypothetical protein